MARWTPFTKASDELSCFLWSAPEQTVKQTIETLVIWDAIALIMTSLLWIAYQTCIIAIIFACVSEYSNEVGWWFVFNSGIALKSRLSLDHRQKTLFHHLWRAVHWSLSAYVLFALITSVGTSSGLSWLTEKTSDTRRFPLYQCLFNISIQFCEFIDLFIYFDSGFKVKNNECLLCWYLGPLLITGSRLGTKQT